MEGLTITHVPGERKFHAHLDGNPVGSLEYTLKDGSMDIIHTNVLPEMRGRGIGGKLVDAACDYSVTNGYTLLTSCSFAAKPVKK